MRSWSPERRGCSARRSASDAGRAGRRGGRHAAATRRARPAPSCWATSATPSRARRRSTASTRSSTWRRRSTWSAPWADYVAANVDGHARRCWTAARAAGVTRFVQVSSPSVAYAGDSLVGAPAGPADPDRARGPYCRSKAMAEQLALAEHDAGFAVLAVRPHLVWGPGDTQLVGAHRRARARRDGSRSSAAGPR